jgi:hypothetical protein
MDECGSWARNRRQSFEQAIFLGATRTPGRSVNLRHTRRVRAKRLQKKESEAPKTYAGAERSEPGESGGDTQERSISEKKERRAKGPSDPSPGGGLGGLGDNPPPETLDKKEPYSQTIHVLRTR